MSDLRVALERLLAHHDRQNGVHDGSPNDCEQGREARAALADTRDGAVDLDAAAQRAVHLLANYLWNEDGENEEWLIEAHDALAASLARASPPPQDPT